MINEFKKNYKAVNVVFLLLSVYVILFPLISKIIQKVWPQFGTCPYLTMTGKPCPLCGGTRYIAGLPQVFHNPSYLLHPFGVMMIIIFLEFIFRIFNLITKKDSYKLVKIDFIIHMIILAIFILYEVLFLIIKQNS